MSCDFLPGWFGPVSGHEELKAFYDRTLSLSLFQRLWL